jgi:hypothetical protein
MLARSRQDVLAREPADGHHHYGLAELASLTLFVSTLLILFKFIVG